MKKRFKIGDTVKYVSRYGKKYDCNPPWDYKAEIGKIYRIMGNCLSIEWGNEVSSLYYEEDIKLFCKKKSKVNCFKCKDRLKCLTRGII